MTLTFERCVSIEKAVTYTHEHQVSHNKYLDLLKQDMLSRLANASSITKSPEDFDQIKTLGTGSFGTVFLVRDTSTFCYHAMKVLDKTEIIKRKNLKQVYMEKKLLQSVNFPFLITLDFSCKDNTNVYLVLPYESGGEMYSLIRKFGSLSQPLATFYAAQAVLALEYLHRCGVVHRDVKPENIFVGESGYIKLGDFGFCKMLKKRTWTLCGTPEYLAPEIIMSKGYTFSVDWWALGVLVYEMSAGYPPFYNSDPMKLYERVLTGQFKCPPGVSSACKSLVKGLLEVDPSKRLGSLKAGVYDIKSHVWFREVDWHALLSQKLSAPYVPVNKSVGDSYPDKDDIKLKRSPQCLYEKEFENF